MSSNTAIHVIETVKNKLQKYIHSQQNEKVKEYLQKLHNTTITTTLLQETKIDTLVEQLALNNNMVYSSTAKILLKKWQDKNFLPKTTDTSKVKTITNTNKPAVEKKLAIKRKSDNDTLHLNNLSESQSSDEFKNGDRDQSSTVKKRKVLSLAEYAVNKKSNTSSSSFSSTSTADSTDKTFTDTQVQEIYAQFHAKYEELAASAPEVSSNVNKQLKQKNTMESNRNEFIANGHSLKMKTNEQQKAKRNDIWEEDDDDDDDDEDNNNHQIQHIQPEPVKNKQTVSSSNHNTQQKKKPTSTSTKRTEDRPVTTTPPSSTVPVEHPQPPSRLPQPVVTKKKPAEGYNFLRSKQERQAVYSGKRTARTNVLSLQDLCVETLKDNVEYICNSHFNRLPYDMVKPIIDAATAEQLDHIINNNPDYTDDVEPLWQQFCLLHFKDAEREECETYYELYWRKHHEKEERLHEITERAKKKRAETVDTARQTKALNIGLTINRHVTSSNKVARQVVGLPPSRSHRGQSKVKKPTMTPLLKKTLKFYNGKN